MHGSFFFIGCRTLIWLGFFSLNFAVGQDQDSLLQVLKSHPHRDTTRVNILISLQDQFLYNYTDSSLTFGLEALEVANELSFVKGQVRAEHFMCIAYILKKEYTLAEGHGNHSLRLAKENNLQAQYTNIQVTIASLNAYQKRFVKAKYQYLQLLTRADSLLDKELQCDVLLSLGGICIHFNDFEEAVNYFSRAHKVAKESKSMTHQEARALIEWGKVISYNNQWAKADSCFRLARLKFKEVGNMRGVVSSLISLTSNFIQLDSIEQAKIHIQEADGLAKQYGIADKLYAIDFMKGLVHLNMREPEKALPYFEAVFSASKDYEKQGDSYGIYGYLGRTYADMGNFKKGYELFTQAYHAHQNYISPDLINRLVSVQKEYEETLLADQVNVMNRLNEVQALALVNERKGKLLAIGSLSVLGLVSVLLVIGFRTKAKLSNELYEKIEEIKSQNEMIEAINLDLRDQAIRAQMNPHFVFNSLNSIQYLVVKGDTVEACKYLSIFSQLLRNVLEYADSQWISIKEEMEILKLYIDMESLRFKGGFEYEIVLSQHEIIYENDLIPNMLVQPFIENSIKHGINSRKGKKTLSVEFFKNNQKKWACRVTDNSAGGNAIVNSHSEKIQLYRPKSLKLIEQRLKMLDGQTGSKSRIEIMDLMDGNRGVIGTEVILEFPSHV